MKRLVFFGILLAQGCRSEPDTPQSSALGEKLFLNERVFIEADGSKPQFAGGACLQITGVERETPPKTNVGAATGSTLPGDVGWQETLTSTGVDITVTSKDQVVVSQKTYAREAIAASTMDTFTVQGLTGTYRFYFWGGGSCSKDLDVPSVQ
jgi:hypothetical protein